MSLRREVGNLDFKGGGQGCMLDSRRSPPDPKLLSLRLLFQLVAGYSEALKVNTSQILPSDPLATPVCFFPCFFSYHLSVISDSSFLHGGTCQ